MHCKMPRIELFGSTYTHHTPIITAVQSLWFANFDIPQTSQFMCIGYIGPWRWRVHVICVVDSVEVKVDKLGIVCNCDPFIGTMESSHVLWSIDGWREAVNVVWQPQIMPCVSVPNTETCDQVEQRHKERLHGWKRLKTVVAQRKAVQPT